MRVLEGYFLTLLVIQFFRKYHDSFEKNMLLGRFLQYLGTRTLDVYLLHFFVILALRTKEINAYFAAYPSPIIHFVVLLLLSVVVVTFCLIISNIIRTSDFLKYYLFGRK
jgi:fucose 4-O-acetylase-like acetyltransferase